MTDMVLLQENDKKSLTLCVDFGTTNSVVSFFNYESREVNIIPFDGFNILPTVVSFYKDDDNNINANFGLEAKSSYIIYPESTVINIKSLLGIKEHVTVFIENESYKFTTTQIVSFILEYIKNKANEYLINELNIDGIFDSLVITVPANSTDKQKNKIYAILLLFFLEP